MSFFRPLILSLYLAELAASPVFAAEIEKIVHKIKPRPGINLKMLAFDSEGAKAVAVLFPGGSGLVMIKNNCKFKGTKGNTLTRSRKKFVANGLVTVLIDAASDHREGEGLTFKYRMTEEHADDIRRAIRRLRKKYPGLPVWLVGHSRGSTSVANVAANIKEGGPDGVVLLASLGVPNKHGGNVLDFNLGGIAIPVLVVHHNDDGCKVTTVTGAKDIKAAMTGSKAAELMIFEGGSSGNGKECGAKSHHGFLGLEKKVVNAVSDWIKSH